MRETNFENIFAPLKPIDLFLADRGIDEVESLSKDVANMMKQQTDDFAKVPWLFSETFHFAKNNQLVRVRGLVHDMPGTEAYAERFRIANNSNSSDWLYGRYRDKVGDRDEITAETDIDDTDTVLNDRHVLVITINSPAQSEFLKSESLQHARRQWLALSDDDEDIADKEIPQSLIVKCYDEIPAKINDVYDFIGILSLDTFEKIQNADRVQGQQSAFDFDIPWYYRDHLPTLHVISAEKVDSFCNSLRPFVIGDLPIIFNMEIRDRLLKSLTFVLNGDCLAAEFLLCHLISSVYGRSGAISLGNLSMNICGIEGQSNIVKNVMDLFQKILSNIEFIEVSINELNKSPTESESNLLPKFVPADTRLQRGRLQLPRGAEIVIDETKLETGKLDENGVRTLQALEDIAQFQRVHYDFVYYQKEFDAEYNVCVFSDYKSLVKCAMIVPLTQPSELPEKPVLEHVDYCQMAVFLANIRDSFNDFELPTDLQDLIADDFANIRKELGGSGFGADDLSSMIVLARWLTISLGSRALTKEIWEQTKEMERERRNRLSSFTKRSAERAK